MEFLRHAKKLKRQDQVVSPQDHFHVGGIGPEAVSRDVRHVERILEFAQQKFLEGALAVETINGFGFERKVRGDQSPVVSVFFECEQVFPEVFGFQRFGSSNRHEGVLFLPMGERIGEGGGFPSQSEFVVSSRDNLSLEGFCHSGDNGVSDLFLVELLDDRFVVETAVQPKTEAGRGDRGWELVHLFL